MSARCQLKSERDLGIRRGFVCSKSVWLCLHPALTAVFAEKKIFAVM